MGRISELYEAYSVDEANEKMKQGWQLYKVFGTPEKRVYILAYLAE